MGFSNKTFLSEAASRSAIYSFSV